MKRRLVRDPGLLWGILGFASLFLSLSATAELNLAPRLESFELDGVKMSQLTFQAGGDSPATYQPPPGWKYSGGRDALELAPENISQARAKIAKIPARSVVTFDEEGLKRLRDDAINSLPQGSEQVTVTNVELNPLQIERNQTYLVELTFTFFGEKFACYSLILNRQPEAISFRLTCRQKDYSQLRQVFQRSLFTWQNL